MSAKPTSETDLVNLSLMQLKQGEVTSLEDLNDTVAQIALKAVAPCRRAALRRGFWNFAKKRDTVPRLASPTPKFDYDSYYQLPNDQVKILRIGEQDACDVDYDIEGTRLLLNGTENSIKLTYTRDETDVNLWDPLFVMAFIHELAVLLCMPVCGDRLIKRELQAQLDKLYLEAAQVDLQERPLKFKDTSEVQRLRDYPESIHSDLGGGFYPVFE